MNNKTCVIYARQSITQGDGESTSIEVQIENCRRWANSHSAEVIGVFSDADDIKGTKHTKDECALLNMLKAGHIGVIPALF